MPELTKEKYEGFARMVALGMSKTEAYAQAYRTVNRDTAKRGGVELTQRAEVAERIVELQEEGAREAVWKLSQRLDLLREMALTPYALVDENSAVCQGVRRKADGVEYKMHDKVAAVALYSQLAGDRDAETQPKVDLLGEMMAQIRSNTYDSAYWKEIVEERWEKLRAAEGWEPVARVATKVEEPKEVESGPIIVDGRYIGERWVGGGNPTAEERRKAQEAERIKMTQVRPRKKGWPLSNGRHERFAQLVASGDTLVAAAMRVYGVKYETAVVRGSAIAREPRVAERIAELKSRGAGAVGWTRQQRLLYLKQLASTPISQVDEWSPYCQGMQRNRHGVSHEMPAKVRAVALYSKLAEQGVAAEQFDDGMDWYVRKLYGVGG